MYCALLPQILRRKQYCKVFKIVNASFMSRNHPIKYNESEQKWREKDGVSENWQLIYKAPMGEMLNYLATYITLSTSVTAFAGAYYAAFVFDVNNLNNPLILGDDVVIANSATECLVYLGTFIAFHIAVRVTLSKYVVRLYKDEDNYLAIFRGYMYNSVKKHEFHLAEFRKLRPTLVVTWGDSRFGLGKKHGILLEDYFKTPQYFNYLLNKKSAENP